MENLIFIKSLHRPYNQNLNSIKFVCDFAKKGKNIPKSEFYTEFYIYLVDRLIVLFNKKEYNIHGFPSKESLLLLENCLQGKSKHEKKDYIIKAIEERNSPESRNIYSTYKASSYYINLAKDKLGFINNENKLSEIGESLIRLRSRPLVLSKKEKLKIFKAIIGNDFHFFISLVLLKKIERKNPDLDIVDLQYPFLKEFYNVQYFTFTKRSQVNYVTVRNYWIEDLKILDFYSNVRKPYKEILKKKYNIPFLELANNIDKFEKIRVRSLKKYLSTSKKFIDAYKEEPKNELGFVSLDKLRVKINLSKEKFQLFISEFYENERNSHILFFNNIVQSISRGQQYFIRQKPVVNLKLKSRK